MPTVLIVDDDAVSRVLIRHLMNRAGYEVIEAEDGAEGLRQFETCDIDLIISDQEMPNLSGLEMRKRLGPALAVPFVLVTGYANEDEFENADDLGQVDAYLTKPVASRSVSELLETLSAVAK